MGDQVYLFRSTVDFPSAFTLFSSMCLLLLISLDSVFLLQQLLKLVSLGSAFFPTRPLNLSVGIRGDTLMKFGEVEALTFK